MGREYSSMSGHIRSVVTVFDDNVTHLCHISCSMMFFRTGVTVSDLFLTQRSTKVHKVNFFHCTLSDFTYICPDFIHFERDVEKARREESVKDK